MTVTARGFQFAGVPGTVSGPRVFLEVVNDDAQRHELQILRAPGGEEVARTPQLDPGGRATLAVVLPAGDYVLRCQVRFIDTPHSELGMLRELSVT